MSLRFRAALSRNAASSPAGFDGSNRNYFFQRMNQGKSPGNDGITVGLLKAIWDEIEGHFFMAVNESITKGELSASQKQSMEDHEPS